MKEQNIRRIFITSLILKGFDSVLEVIAGVLLFFTGFVTRIIETLIQNELIEDPTDFLATQLQHFLPYFSSHSQLFGAFYLLSHGVVKIFLVIQLLRRKLWAYPVTMIIFGLFIVYQLYRLTLGYSSFLLILTILDIIVILLTWHEYNFMKRHEKTPVTDDAALNQN